MVKTLLLGLLTSIFCILVNSTPVIQIEHIHKNITTITDLLSSSSSSASSSPASDQKAPFEDPGARSERSTNLSHVTGASRKIQMFIKNRHLQLLPDGTVNGTTDDTSAYTILQRTTVGIGKVKIQGVATCQYLCMDGCGYLYGSRDFNDECIFKEIMEKHHYNSYSSNKYSNSNRTMYLALNRHGQLRKVILKTGNDIGRLTSYTRVLIRQADDYQLPPMRHNGHNICPNVINHQNTNQQRKIVEPLRCRKRRRRKRKKRKCPEEDGDSELCQKRHSVSNDNNKTKIKKCDDDKDTKDSDECQRELTIRKKNKLNIINSEKPLVSIQKKKKKIKKGVRKRIDVEYNSTDLTTISIQTTQSTNFDDITPDIDYGIESSTHPDWEDSTALPDISMAVSITDAKNSARSHSDSD